MSSNEHTINLQILIYLSKILFNYNIINISFFFNLKKNNTFFQGYHKSKI